MLKKIFKGEKIWVLGDQAMVSGCAFLTQILLARFLGLSVYGYFSAIVLTQLFLLSLQQAALTGMYQVTFPMVTPDRQKSYTTGMVSIQAGFMLILLAAGCLLTLCYPDAVAMEVKLAALLNILLCLAQDFWRRILLTRGQTAKAFIIDAINNGLQIAGLLSLIYTGSFHFTACLWVCALSYVPAVILGQIWVKPGRLSLYQSRLVYRMHATQSGWMLLSALLQWFAGNFYILAAGWWLGPAALGALRLGQYLFGLLNILMQAVESYVLPKAAKVSGQSGQMFLYLRALLIKLLSVMVPLLAIIVCAHRPLLQLFGKGEGQTYAYIIYGLAIVYVFVTIGYPVRIALRAFSLNRAYFTGYVLAAIVSFSTAWMFIHAWELKGVLAGLLLSQLVLLTYWIWILQKRQFILWKSFISY